MDVMLRCTEWRRLPQDPRSPLAWWWREVRLAAFVLLIGTPILCALVAFAVFTNRFVLGVVLIPLGSVLVGGFAQAQRRRVSSRVAALAPSPAPTETFPVESSFFYGTDCTGRDQGMASVVDGWLHVEGLRTSYSLRPIDTTRIGALPSGADVFELPGGQRIEIRSLGSASDRATFGETIRIWHRFTFGSVAGEPTLPPIEVHATALVRPLSMLVVGLAACLGLLGVGLYMIAHGAYLVPPVVGGLFFVVRDCERAVETIRRLARIDRQARTLEKTGTLPPLDAP